MLQCYSSRMHLQALKIVTASRFLISNEVRIFLFQLDRLTVYTIQALNFIMMSVDYACVSYEDRRCEAISNIL